MQSDNKFYKCINELLISPHLSKRSVLLTSADSFWLLVQANFEIVFDRLSNSDYHHRKYYYSFFHQQISNIFHIIQSYILLHFMCDVHALEVFERSRFYL